MELGLLVGLVGSGKGRLEDCEDSEPLGTAADSYAPSSQG